MDYQHPVMDPAIAAQQRLHEIQGPPAHLVRLAHGRAMASTKTALKSGLRVAADFQALPAWAQL